MRRIPIVVPAAGGLVRVRMHGVRAVGSGLEAIGQAVVYLACAPKSNAVYAAYKAAMKDAATFGYSTATDVADWLVRVLDMPFRDAHHVTGAIVKLAETTESRRHR